MIKIRQIESNDDHSCVSCFIDYVNTDTPVYYNLGKKMYGIQKWTGS